jgi:hypothetical protein
MAVGILALLKADEDRGDELGITSINFLVDKLPARHYHRAR